jgi:hypothetical protein
VQFSSSSSSLRIYDLRHDFSNYSGGTAKALSTMTPLVNPAISVQFPQYNVPNIAVTTEFVVNGRPTPVRWVLELFCGGHLVGT